MVIFLFLPLRNYVFAYSHSYAYHITSLLWWPWISKAACKKNPIAKHNTVWPTLWAGPRAHGAPTAHLLLGSHRWASCQSSWDGSLVPLVLFPLLTPSCQMSLIFPKHESLKNGECAALETTWYPHRCVCECWLWPLLTTYHKNCILLYKIS